MDFSVRRNPQKGDQMKKLIILPIILALGVGMSFAQKKEGLVSASQNKVMIDDASMYLLSPKKNTKTKITQGDVTYTACQGTLCKDTSDLFQVTYFWQHFDINDSTWKSYVSNAVTNDSATFVPGEYRLVARYLRNKEWTCRRANTSECLHESQARSADRQLYPIKEVKVNGQTFDSLHCANSSTGVTTRTMRWRCEYTSPVVTVGKKKPIVFKPVCMDGTSDCDAEYFGPTMAYEGDSIIFRVKNKNEDYGMGLDYTNGFDSYAAYTGDSSCLNGASGFGALFCALAALAVNFGGMKIVSADASTIALFYEPFYKDDYYYYAYQKVSETSDTILYPMSRRIFDLIYRPTQNGSVTGPAKAFQMERVYVVAKPDEGFDLEEIKIRGLDENGELQEAIDLADSIITQNSDGSYVLGFLANNGFDQNIYSKFKQTGVKVTMNDPEHGTYKVYAKTYEHANSESVFYSNAQGSQLSIVPSPSKGYGVKRVACSYTTNNSGEVTKVLTGDSAYSCPIPVSDSLKNTNVSVQVTFGKINEIELNVTGHGTIVAYVDGTLDANGEYTKGFCSNQPTEEEGNACTVLEGDSVVIKTESSTGHPLSSLSCMADGTNSVDCLANKGIRAQDKDIVIEATFKALNYTLSKTGSHKNDFDLYVGWNSTTPVNEAHEFDTVYVRSKDGKHVVVPGNNGTNLYINDPKTGVDVIYFIMPARDYVVDVGDEAYYSTVNLARNIVGKGTAVINFADGSSRTLEDGDLIRVLYARDFFSFFRSIPAEGYTFDSTRCYYGDSYSDSAEIHLLQNGMYAGAFAVEFENDITCDVVFSPKTYKIAWSQADTNGFVQGVPEKGKTDESISFKVSPVADYEIDFVKAYYTEKDSNNKDVSVFLKLSNTYDKKKNTYTYKFSMPAHDVDVEVAFKEIKSSSSSAKAKSSSSSAKAKSSSSKAKAKSSSSSAKAKSSSSKAKSSSSKKKTVLPVMAQVPQFSLFVNGRSMQIAGARVGSKMEVFDLQGHRVLSGNVDAANFSVAMPRSGSYLVRIDGQTQNVNIK